MAEPMPTHQKVSWTALIGGLAAFLLGASELLEGHQSWQELHTPAAWAHALYLLAMLFVAIGGALGVDLQGLIRARKGQ